MSVSEWVSEWICYGNSTYYTYSESAWSRKCIDRFWMTLTWRQGHEMKRSVRRQSQKTQASGREMRKLKSGSHWLWKCNNKCRCRGGCRECNSDQTWCCWCRNKNSWRSVARDGPHWTDRREAQSSCVILSFLSTDDKLLKCSQTLIHEVDCWSVCMCVWYVEFFHIMFNLMYISCLLLM